MSKCPVIAPNSGNSTPNVRCGINFRRMYFGSQVPIVAFHLEYVDLKSELHINAAAVNVVTVVDANVIIWSTGLCLFFPG